uniref:Uncharacterized protein n=1 Tax=Anguilla anguilla TaxID=7936 RepID=A0A0E9SYX2_ANGAN
MSEFFKDQWLKTMSCIFNAPQCIRRSSGTQAPSNRVDCI